MKNRKPEPAEIKARSIDWTASGTRGHAAPPEHNATLAEFADRVEAYAWALLDASKIFELRDSYPGDTYPADSYVGTRLLIYVTTIRKYCARLANEQDHAARLHLLDEITRRVWKITRWMYARDHKERAQTMRGRRRGGAKGAATKRDDLAERNKRIVSALDRGDPVKQIAERHGLSMSQIRRIRQQHNRITREL